MHASRLLLAGLAFAVLLGAAAGSGASTRGSAAELGPLRTGGANPRYFSDANGRPVYLTGSHIWTSLVDRGRKYPPPRFRYAKYLDFLEQHGHNFIRLWTWELPYAWWEGRPWYASPQPWRRTGPGRAADGRPRFDLRRFNPQYFERLRRRVAAARARGMYVSVMLFEGWALQFADRPWNWRTHPFNRANNINGINGDADGDGDGTEIQILVGNAVYGIQARYVAKVVETVGAFDNVMFEVVNESSPQSTLWQAWVIEEVRRQLARRGLQRPVGMTYQNPSDSRALFESAADWISPAGLWYLTSPPPADGRKVSLSDTDHHCGVCGDSDFAWRNFTRGHNPILMDTLGRRPSLEAARRAMGATRRVAERIDLANAVPHPDLCSTGFCLASPGREYVVFQPGTGPVRVRLPPGARAWQYAWIDHLTGGDLGHGSVVAAGEATFAPPRPAPVVLHLRAG